ncbi:hypothetical protein OIV83_000935 [Microbotryomycetes sp. JL201]|nr:hypothetical protein OIV83_000935 [Microbotryomycetes sp. JL201]
MSLEFVARTPTRARNIHAPTSVHSKRTVSISGSELLRETTAAKLPAALSPFHATLQAHLARTPSQAHARDSDSPHTFTVLSAWKENLPVTLTASSSSQDADGNSSPRAERHRQRRSIRVTFSDTPLRSAMSSPRHKAQRRFHPYPNTHGPLSSSSINLDSPPSSSTLASSPPAGQGDHHKLVKHKTLARLKPSSDDDDDDDDDNTTSDDEEDEFTVEAMLLSEEQIAASPARLKTKRALHADGTLSTPTHGPTAPSSAPVPPRSILKRRESTTPIKLARTAAEGSLRNARRKHAPSFDYERQDAVADQPTVSRARTSAGGREASAGGSSSSHITLRAGQRAASRQIVDHGNTEGNGDDDDGDRRSRRPREGRIVWDIRDTDPVNYESPLRVLKASLRPLSDAQTPRRNRSDLPEMAPPFLVRHLSPSKRSMPQLHDMAVQTPSSSKHFLPPSLGDIEAAYARICRTTVRIPNAIPADAPVFEPVRKYRQTLLECLERDLANIVNFSAWTQTSARSDRDSSPTPLQAGQTKSALSGEHLRRLKDELAIAQVAIKTCAALFSRQQTLTLFQSSELNAVTLPPAMIRKNLPGAIRSLVICLSTKDKLCQNQNLGAQAAAALIKQHPKQMLEQASIWLKPLLAGLWDAGKRTEIIRARTLEALSEVAAILGSKVSSEWLSDRDDWRDTISKQLLEVFHDIPIGAVEGFTNLDLLVAQFKAGIKGTRVSANDVTWASLHTFLSILPVLLGARFRRLNEKGITPYVELLSLFSDSTTPSLWHLMSGLAWSHAAYAFFLVPPSTASGSPVPRHWLFRHDQKRLNVLFNIFNHRRLPTGELGANGPHAALHEANSHVVGHLLAGISAGLSILLGAADAETPKNDSFLNHLDTVFSNALAPEIRHAAASPLSNAKILALAVLAAIVAPHPESPNLTTIEILVNKALFEGIIAKASTPDVAQQLTREAVAASVQPEQVPTWGSAWIVSRVNLLVNLLKELGLEYEPPESDAICLVWTNLFATFAQAKSEDNYLLTMIVGVNDILKNSTNQRQHDLSMRIYRQFEQTFASDARIQHSKDHGVRSAYHNTLMRGRLADRTHCWSQNEILIALTSSRKLELEPDDRAVIDLACATAESWARSLDETALNGDDLREIARFVSLNPTCLHQSSWSSLGRKLVDGIAERAAEPTLLQESLSSMLTPLTDPDVIIPFFSFLLRYSQHVKEEHQAALAAVVVNYIYQLAVKPMSSTIPAVEKMLELCSLKQLAVLYPDVLKALEPSTGSSQEDLDRIMPVLKQINRLAEGEHASPTCFGALITFWAAKFDGRLQEVPPGLVDVLWLAQKMSGFELQIPVEDTQSMSQPAGFRSESYESDRPRPAQKLGSVQTSSSTTARRQFSGYEAEADVSQTETGVAPSASTAEPAARLFVPPSPSMRPPEQAHAADKSPSVQEETPRSVELARVRASLANMAAAAPSKSAGCTPAQQQEVDVTEGDLSLSLESSRESSPAVSASLSIAVASDVETGSPSASPTTMRHEETLRNLFAMPVETVVRTAKRVGGSPGIHRFLELGEAAKKYFTARSKSN